MRGLIALVAAAVAIVVVASFARASETPRVEEPETLVDLNVASYDDLAELPTVGDAFAQRIIDGRPYSAPNQLLTRRIVPRVVYTRIRSLVVVEQEPEYMAMR